jgi:hypothetical protein
MLRAFEHIKRIRQEYFAVHEELAIRPKIGKFSTKNKKNFYPKSPFYMYMIE